MLFALSLEACPDRDASGNHAAAPAETGSQAARNDVPSCYATVRPGVGAPPPGRAVFVLVDQTTGLDQRLRETVRSNVERLLSPGSSFTIGTFSAFSQGHFATVLASGSLEAPLTDEQRLHLAAQKVQEMEACLAQQAGFARQLASQRIQDATNASAPSFSHSEIMAGLKNLSAAVRAAPAAERYVIIVSDLLENSTATSFYANRNLREIAPEAEMTNARDHQLIADFANARVAVVGAGLLSPESAPDRVRNVRALNALRIFWQQWFERSRARLVQYGEPDLTAPLGWADQPAS
jgi:hypothetical protein